jgi:hypothetical protein
LRPSASDAGQPKVFRAIGFQPTTMPCASIAMYASCDVSRMARVRSSASRSRSARRAASAARSRTSSTSRAINVPETTMVPIVISHRSTGACTDRFASTSPYATAANSTCAIASTRVKK